MKRLRLSLLFLTLLVFLFAFYYRLQNSVRIETVLLHSKITGRVLPYNVILPRGYSFLSPWRLRYPVLYLLHGHGGDYNSWLSQTDLAKSVSDFKMIVVTPEGENGWYTDSETADNGKYETFLIKELIPDVESRFRVIPARDGRAIAGYSMGGYGALKFGLKYPEIFVFAGSMSGAFDAPLRTDEASIMQTFGPESSPTREANNLVALANQISPAAIRALPYFYFDCGKDDSWLTVNRELEAVLESKRIRHDYREANGAHDWAYWDRQVRTVLQLAASTLAPART